MVRRAALLALTGALGCHVDPPLPPVATCATVADHVYALLEPKNARARAIRDTIEQRCDADRWSERSRTCIAEEPALDARRGCRETLTTTQRGQLDGALAAVPPAAGAAVHAPAADACPVVAVQECAEFCDALVTLADCQGLPPSAREMLREAWLQQLAVWGTMPIDAQRQVCAQRLVMFHRIAGCHP